MLRVNLIRIIAWVRHLACSELIESNAQGVQVGAAIEWRIICNLFGRHVVGSAQSEALLAGPVRICFAPDSKAQIAHQDGAIFQHE